MDYITDIESRHKCAHEQCECQIPTTQEYCSEYCSDADDVDEVDSSVTVNMSHAG